jgi:hypothetical protein
MDEQAEPVTQQLSKRSAKGGYARASALSQSARQEIASKAAATRWGTNPESGAQPEWKAEYTGKLVFGDLELECAVLDDGRRVLSERGVTKALGGKRGGSHWRLGRASASGSYLPVFISANNLRPYIQPSLAQALAQPVAYRAKGGGRANGVAATLLPEICDVWLKARREGALLPSQEHIAAKAEILLTGLATVGIVALVDEATGYQAVRDRNELHRILEAYIVKEFLPWSKRFPDEFYKELFRLKGWPYNPPSPKRPRMVGKLTNYLVYQKLPPGVLEELRQKNPIVKDGRRKHKHHQFLTEEVGNPHLEKHLASVTTLMRVSMNWSFFERLFDRAFPPLAPRLPGFEETEDESET